MANNEELYEIINFKKDVSYSLYFLALQYKKDRDKLEKVLLKRLSHLDGPKIGTLQKIWTAWPPKFLPDIIILLLW